MRMIRHLVVKCGILCIALSILPAHAARFHFFDKDGTLNHDSGVNEDGKLPAWRTYWVLDLISSVNNGWHVDEAQKLLRRGELPEQIYLNKNEIDRMQERFATREERVGNTEPMALDLDPLNEGRRNPDVKAHRPKTIYPGYYLINKNTAYTFHRDSPGKLSPLVSNFYLAHERMKKDPDHYEWRGPAFKYLAQAISRQSEEERIFFSSDRDHEAESWLQWLWAMHRLHYIPKPVKSLPNGKEIFPKPLSSTSIEARNYGSIFEFDSRKVNALMNRVMLISRSPTPLHSTLGSDYNEAVRGVRRPMHEILIYENKPEYMREIVKIMKKNAALFPQFKFIIYHAGDPESVASLLPYAPPSEFSDPEAKRWFIVTPSGTGLRSPVSAEELAEITGVKNVDCEKQMVAPTQGEPK